MCVKVYLWLSKAQLFDIDCLKYPKYPTIKSYFNGYWIIVNFTLSDYKYMY